MTRRNPSPPGRAVLCAALLGLMPTAVFAQDRTAPDGSALWQDVDARALAPRGRRPRDHARPLPHPAPRHGRPAGTARPCAARADGRRARRVGRARAAAARRRLPALPHRGVADHGAGARRRSSPRSSTYRGQGLDDPHRDRALRLDARRLPRHGALRAAARSTSTPTAAATPRTTSAYFKRDYRAPAGDSFRCLRRRRRGRGLRRARDAPRRPSRRSRRHRCAPTAWPWPRPSSTRDFHGGDPPSRRTS